MYYTIVKTNRVQLSTLEEQQKELPTLHESFWDDGTHGYTKIFPEPPIFNHIFICNKIATSSLSTFTHLHQIPFAYLFSSVDWGLDAKIVMIWADQLG